MNDALRQIAVCRRLLEDSLGVPHQRTQDGSAGQGSVRQGARAGVEPQAAEGADQPQQGSVGAGALKLSQGTGATLAEPQSVAASEGQRVSVLAEDGQSQESAELELWLSSWPTGSTQLQGDSGGGSDVAQAVDPPSSAAMQATRAPVQATSVFAPALQAVNEAFVLLIEVGNAMVRAFNAEGAVQAAFAHAQAMDGMELVMAAAIHAYDRAWAGAAPASSVCKFLASTCMLLCPRPYLVQTTAHLAVNCA